MSSISRSYFARIWDSGACAQLDALSYERLIDMSSVSADQIPPSAVGYDNTILTKVTSLTQTSEWLCPRPEFWCIT